MFEGFTQVLLKCNAIPDRGLQNISLLSGLEILDAHNLLGCLFVGPAHACVFGSGKGGCVFMFKGIASPDHIVVTCDALPPWRHIPVVHAPPPPPSDCMYMDCILWHA